MMFRLKNHCIGFVSGLLIIAASNIFICAESLAINGAIESRPESELILFGESTIRNFSTDATIIKVTGNINADKNAIADGSAVKSGNFELIIPIAGLKSKSELFDKHLWETIKADQFPEIHGVLKSYEVLGKKDDNSFNVRASVDLNIAGVLKNRMVNGAISVEGDTIRIQGMKKLLMTDFGIEPPRIMLGTVKVSDEITIRFDLVIGMKQTSGKGV